MDVAHYTINSTSGAAALLNSGGGRILVAKEKGRAFFVVRVGGSHLCRPSKSNVEGPFDSLRGIDLGLFGQ